MQKLNLPSFDCKLKSSENKTLIFDNLRKKYVVLTPEEWVRQHFIAYLIDHKKYPKSLIGVEKQLTINKLKKRTDLLVFNRIGAPHIIVECKAPNVVISQDTFDQIARYNLTLNANYLVVTNGLVHFYCQMDQISQSYHFLKEIPDYTK